MLSIDKKEKYEKLATIAVFTGIFLPVRLLFYTYVSQYWLGSFGVMTILLVSLLYLSSRGKLGWLGKIISKHVLRFSKSKLGLVTISSSLFILYFFGNVIYGIEFAPEPLKQTISAELESQGINTMQDVTTNAPRTHFEPAELVLGLLLLMIPNPVVHSIYGIINDMSNGWVMHFSTVIFIEQLEVLGMVVYFRWVKKVKSEPVPS